MTKNTSPPSQPPSMWRELLDMIRDAFLEFTKNAQNIKIERQEIINDFHKRHDADKEKILREKIKDL